MPPGLSLIAGREGIPLSGKGSMERRSLGTRMMAACPLWTLGTSRGVRTGRVTLVRMVCLLCHLTPLCTSCQLGYPMASVVTPHLDHLTTTSL